MKQLLIAAMLLLASATIFPGAQATDEPLDCHGPLDGWQYCEVELGKCHAGEELDQGDFHAHAECQPNDGKSRCGVDAYAMPLLVTRHCGSTYETVWPVSANSVGSCEEHPGYRQCDYPAGPCTVTVYYLYHDAQYVIDPHCDPGTLPAASAASAADPCQQYPGYERCVYRVGPCTVTTTYYYHDAFYVIEPDCQKPSPSAAPSASAASPCQQYPGFQQCRVDLGLCDAELRYYQHDAFFVVGANCYGKNSTCSYYSHQVYGHEPGLDCKEFIAEHLPGPSATTGQGADVCQDRPGGAFCGYSGGGCEAGVFVGDLQSTGPVLRCTPPNDLSV